MVLAAQILPIVMSASLSAVVVAIGLDAAPADLLYLVRPPIVLARAFLAISVIVPLVAVAASEALRLAAPVKAALILMAVAPAPPGIIGKGLRAGGRRDYVYGLYVGMVLLAVVVAPITVQLLDAAYQADLSAPTGPLVLSVVISLVVPLGIGLEVRALFPAAAARVAPWASRIGGLLLGVGNILLFAKAWPDARQWLGSAMILAILLVVLAGLGAGHLLAGPDMRDRAVLAEAAVGRHPALALALAEANFQDDRIPPVALVFVIVTMLVTRVHRAWVQRSAKA